MLCIESPSHSAARAVECKFVAYMQHDAWMGVEASDNMAGRGVFIPASCLYIMDSEYDRAERAQRDPSYEELAAHADETATANTYDR